MTNDLERNGYTLRYAWTGTGNNNSRPVMVFSHPLGSNSGVWEPQCRALHETFRILLYDHPGHGRSALWPAKQGIPDYGEDVLALLDHLGIKKAHFCGLSLGGMVGQWLGAHYPERFHSLILANTCARIADTRLLKARIKSLADCDDLNDISESVIGGWLTPAFREANPSTVEKETDRLLANTARGYAATAEMICEMDLRDCAVKIEPPVLVIGGSGDRATPPEWNRELACAIPDASYVELPGAHLTCVEAADEFTGLIRKFCAK